MTDTIIDFVRAGFRSSRDVADHTGLTMSETVVKLDGLARRGRIQKCTSAVADLQQPAFWTSTENTDWF